MYNLFKSSKRVRNKYKIKLNLNKLYELVKVNPDKELTTQELKYINIEVLYFSKSYLKYVTINKIKEIFELSLAYWLDNSKNTDLKELRVKAWALNDQLFSESMLDSYNEIILRLLLTTLYDDKNKKEDMEQSLEFIDFLIDNLNQLE
ncbi:hypothetical protein JP28_10070 [Gallibacterium anatis]|uniref:hypothetical protein n=1 Tax=Gallibacterium anatis TaxID=750 RepID=UPI0005311F18|nr:hypothetical protein [Gallibacterium anatis]KGQ43090.1 hypothetical protein JP28_10070 [Gallibacterium anatis]KGQ53005.1 hypothetical protein IO46_04695 [Gallibacterium anatis]KGQ59130.1 hypothetical protein IO45_07125 [Gallibacterium anatis]